MSSSEDRCIAFLLVHAGIEVSDLSLLNAVKVIFEVLHDDFGGLLVVGILRLIDEVKQCIDGLHSFIFSSVEFVPVSGVLDEHAELDSVFAEVVFHACINHHDFRPREIFAVYFSSSSSQITRTNPEFLNAA